MGTNRREKSMTGRGKSTRGKADRRQTKPTASQAAGLAAPERAEKPKGRKRTDWKAAEETLRQSEANYRSLFENIPDGIYRTAPDGRILSANPALVRMFGYEEEEEFKLKYRAAQMYSNPADRNSFLQLLEEQNEIHNSEIILKRRDGRLLIVLENAHVVRDEEGKTLFYEGVLTDITERKRMEDTLRESEAFSQAILNNSPIGISVRSRSGRLLSANEAWKRIWAMPDSEVAEDAAHQRSALKFDASDDYLGAYQADVRRVYEQGGYLHLPELKTIHTHPGAAEWVAQHFYAIQNATGQVDRVVILTEDITERKRAEIALRESEENYRDLVDHSLDLICTHDLDGILLSANPAAIKLSGFSEKELLGRNLREFLVPATRGEFDAYLKEIHSKGAASGLMLVRIKSGECRLWEYSNTLRTQGVASPIVRGAARDITERKRAEAALRESEWRNKIVSDLITDYIFVVDVGPGGILKLRWVSDSMLRVTGRSIEDAADSNMWGQIIHPDDAKRFQGFVNRILATARAGEIECRSFYKDNKERWIRIFAQPQCDEENVVTTIVGAVQDITARKQAEDELRLAKESAEVANRALQQALEREMTLSRTDSLTGVFNRRYFFEFVHHEFEAAKRYQRPLSIVMFDLDNFKPFNDTHGHQAGDEILKCVAEVTHRQLRGADILARYGGDEFVILLSNSNAREAATVAERIRESIAAYLMETKDCQANITISMGIAECRNDTDTVDRLIQHADKALYNAKNAGRNCVIVYREEAD